MKLEDNAKVVVSVWGGGRFRSIPYRASYFAPADLEEKVEFTVFFQVDGGKTASAAKN